MGPRRPERDLDVDGPAEARGPVDEEGDRFFGHVLGVAELPGVLDDEAGAGVGDLARDPLAQVLSQRRLGRMPGLGRDAPDLDRRPGPEEAVMVEMVGGKVGRQDLAVERMERMDIAGSRLLRGQDRRKPVAVNVGQDLAGRSRGPSPFRRRHGRLSRRSSCRKPASEWPSSREKTGRPRKGRRRRWRARSAADRLE